MELFHPIKFKTNLLFTLLQVVKVSIRKIIFELDKLSQIMFLFLLVLLLFSIIIIYLRICFTFARGQHFWEEKEELKGTIR